jgi:acetyl esterase/lipase
LVTQTTNHFPAQENDMESAVTYLKNNTGAYNISNEFVYLGISAGAHLSLLQAYKHSDILQPKGIISFFGPVDLQQLYVHSDVTIPGVLRTIIGASLQENPDLFAQASPINYVTSASAPTLMLHGDKDVLVPVEQAYLLRDKLNSLNVSNKLVVYPGQGHGWFGKDLTDSFQQVEDFVKGL